MTQDIDKLIVHVVKQVKGSGQPIRGIAIKSGLHPNTLQGMLKPGWEPSITTLRAVQKTLDYLEKNPGVKLRAAPKKDLNQNAEPHISSTSKDIPKVTPKCVANS
jgi:hypothetical protein